MIEPAFEGGRRTGNVVQQMRVIYLAIDTAKDRDSTRAALRAAADNAYQRFARIASEEGVLPNEQREMDRLHGCCVDEDFYQRHKTDLLK